MDMMKVRIHFYKDLLNHTYFFEDPFYNTEHAKKFVKKLKQPPEIKIKILYDLMYKIGRAHV